MPPRAQCGWALCRSGPQQWDICGFVTERLFLTPIVWRDGSSCWGAGLRLALLMLALVSPGTVAQSTVETPRIIHVVVDNAYAPYSFQSDEGKLQGILIDQWQAWERKTGIKGEIHGLDWGGG